MPWIGNGYVIRSIDGCLCFGYLHPAIPGILCFVVLALCLDQFHVVTVSLIFFKRYSNGPTKIFITGMNKQTNEFNCEFK